MSIFSFIPFQIKLQVLYFLSKRSLPEFNKYKGVRKVIVFLAADYGNLGDIAITYAQTKYLENHYIGYKVLELPISQTLNKLKALKHVCSRKDIITIVGGGNMGDLYDQIELFRQLVVRQFPENKIISFPQTVDFSQTVNGQKALRKAIRVYSMHLDLILMAREEKSYQDMMMYFPKNKVVLSPDVVMTLDCTTSTLKRKGITLCLRKDNEKLLASNEQEELLHYIHSAFSDVYEYDTHIGSGHFPVNKRIIELNKIWLQFSSSEWVVTDRLHGMIFCFITGTSAIVLPNSNHKVKMCYEWIKDCGYIYLVENYSLNAVTEILNSKCRSKSFTSVSGKIINAFKNSLSSVL